MAAHVISVNVGQPAVTPWLGGPGRTSIQKHPVDGPVQAHPLGLTGDQVSDTKFHGGLDMAVYAFAREDLDAWETRLGAQIPDGQFGENLTTHGIDVNAALLGERWRIGTAVLEVSHVRIPCDTFTRWMRQSGYDATQWVKRFSREGRPGPYLRVIEPGCLAAGDAVEVLFRPGHDVTVTMAFRALTTERRLLPRLLEVGDALAAEPREAVETYLARAARKEPAPTLD